MINRIPNPSSEIVPTPTSWSGASVGNPVASVVRTAAWAKVGGFASRYTTSRDDGATVLSRLGSGLAASIPVEPGEEVAFRHFVVPRVLANAPRNLRARIYWYTDDGTASLISSASVGLPTGVPVIGQEYDLFVAGVVPSDAVRAAPATYIAAGAAILDETIQIDQDAWVLTRNPPGTLTAFDAATKAAEMPVYFDGDTPGAEWLGAPHASESRYPAEAAEVLVPGNEVLVARRAWPKSQELLAGAAESRVGQVAVGWHGTDVHDEAGAFAVVRAGGPYDDGLIGEVLAVRRGSRVVYVYVVGARDVPADISLARRAYAALGGLYLSEISANVEVVA